VNFNGVIAAGSAVVLLLSAGGSVSCRRAPDPGAASPVAVVNGEAIGLDELEEALRPVLIDSPALSPIETSAWEELKFNALNQLIERRLLIQEAERMGIKVKGRETEEREREIRKDYPEGEFESMLTSRFIDYPRWRKNLEKDLVIEKLIQESVFAEPVTDTAVERYYRDHLEQYQIPVQVRARQIVVRTEEEAQAVRKRIVAGEEFAALAGEVSLSPDAESGGDLGFFSRGVMPPEFDQVVFALSPGKISPVVKSPYGYHLFVGEEVREGHTRTIDQVRDEIRNILAREAEEKAYQKWLGELKAKASIMINRALLEEEMRAPRPSSQEE